LDLTGTWIGITCLSVFTLSYILVAAEERLHMRKSVPVMVAAGVIWLMIGIAYRAEGRSPELEKAIRHNLLEFAELFLFLLSAITYVNTMGERKVFDLLRQWLIRKEFSLRALFWITGFLAFIMSPIADNLTTALVIGAVVIAVGSGNPKFVTVGCINVVVAANAGGAFSPFGDITTLMVWQKGTVPFFGFMALVIPSLVNWLVPATIMSFALGKGLPARTGGSVILRPGAWVVVGMFIGTIAGTVVLQSTLGIPPALGMMTGLGALKLYGVLLKRATERKAAFESEGLLGGIDPDQKTKGSYDVFKILERLEWDTLMFFYGVILCVGGLGTLGYLASLSTHLYGNLGPTSANVLFGGLSAVVDNIPVMFALLTMDPEMSQSQWLLATLTIGVGGSLLSIGSAAGVALMGQARGIYTFMSHLKWTWAVLLGYLASIGVHLLINGR
jgi:Na+/H+ antiporter NhaD/arsenite permease-like protein